MMLKDYIMRLPVLRRIKQIEQALLQYEIRLDNKQEELNNKQNELNDKQRELETRQNGLEILRQELDDRSYQLKSDILTYEKIFKEFQQKRPGPGSRDHTAWRHPFLTGANIRRFRDYSMSVRDFALEHARRNPELPSIAFTVNMAQNMHKWAMLAQKFGARVALFPVAWDKSAIGAPEWENFDGEWADIYDGEGFLRSHPDIPLEVPCHRLPMESFEFYDQYRLFLEGDRKPLLRTLAAHPNLRLEAMLHYPRNYHYLNLAAALGAYDVVYGASMPVHAYFSGKPYCVSGCGHEMEDDIGRGDEYGQVMSLCFNAARFFFISNPHQLGHCRRLGLTNGLFLPYPMDDSRYCPGQGQARREWEARYGGKVFVLMSARLDPEVKGQDQGFFQALADAASRCPDMRFVFLGWGKSVEAVRSRLEAVGLGRQAVILPPVGKKRLLDYYRSCDLVLDQLLYGAYGCTALEAAAAGKPVAMRLDTDKYSALYGDAVMPAWNLPDPKDLVEALTTWYARPDLRQEAGERMRNWLVATHGEQATMPLLLALLRLTVDQRPLPPELANPLLNPESEEEQRYNQACVVATQ